MTDIIKTEKTSIEIKTESDPSASVHQSVIESHDNDRISAAENVAKERADEVLPDKVEQPLASEDLEKLIIKKDDSQEENTETVINSEVCKIFQVLYTMHPITTNLVLLETSRQFDRNLNVIIQSISLNHLNPQIS
jgi:hypothetical protein